MAEKDKAHLGCLEEDDEFEEFPAEGKHYSQLFYWMALYGRMHDVCVYTEHLRVFQNGLARKRTKTMWMFGKTTGMTIMSSVISADNYAPKEKHSSVVWRKTTSSKNFQPEVSVIHSGFASIAALYRFTGFTDNFSCAFRMVWQKRGWWRCKCLGGQLGRWWCGGWLQQTTACPTGESKEIKWKSSWKCNAYFNLTDTKSNKIKWMESKYWKKKKLIEKCRENFLLEPANA